MALSHPQCICATETDKHCAVRILKKISNLAIKYLPKHHWVNSKEFGCKVKYRSRPVAEGRRIKE